MNTIALIFFTWVAVEIIVELLKKKMITKLKKLGFKNTLSLQHLTTPWSKELWQLSTDEFFMCYDKEEDLLSVAKSEEEYLHFHDININNPSFAEIKTLILILGKNGK